MYAKKITFTDFNGVEREQTFYFHLSKAELTEMNLSKKGGLQSYVERISNTNDTPALAKLFKDLIKRSYGEKSDDGMRFIKRDPVRGNLADEFEQTEAYSVLYMELATDAHAAAEFINGLVPQDVAAKAKEINDGHAYPEAVMKA
jgi:hypothetical protein